MPHVPLLVNIGVVLAYALVGGLLARRVGLPTIVGYLVAGVALGPFTPGFRGDADAIGQLAELGVIMLMFGVGLHFSLEDLWEVRQIAIPGALLQMIVVTVGGYGLGRFWGWSVGGSWLLGIALSVASTIVLLRTLADYGWLETPYGKVAVGWLVFEDLVTVAILVLLPVVAAPAAGVHVGESRVGDRQGDRLRDPDGHRRRPNHAGAARPRREDANRASSSCSSC